MTEYGTLVDFSAGFPDPAAVLAAGHRGVACYVSDRRRDAQWMAAKPLTRDYADACHALGLDVVAIYQYGKTGNQDPPDWHAGYDGGCRHAERGLIIGGGAGLPAHRPIFAPVDDNPTLDEWNRMASPFLAGWASVAGLPDTGGYMNARCIEWALEDQVCTWFMQHNWSGDPSINGHHPAAHLHQVRIDKDRVGGIGVDVNVALRADFGQWAAAPVLVAATGEDDPAWRELRTQRIGPA